MKKYRIGLCYTGYAWQDIEASSIEEAYDKAVEMELDAGYKPVIIDWERWYGADNIREAED
jgi:hypothetical protein